MTRPQLIERISTFLARFTTEVRQRNEASLFDINVLSETALIPLLRELYDLRGLQNANAVAKNAAAVDLIDYESRVSIQVTSTPDARKITNTLTRFFKSGLNRSFDRIIFYIITERQDTYTKDFQKLIPDGFDFDPDRDIIDNGSLLRFITAQVLDVQKLARIEKLLAAEFSDFKIEERKTRGAYEQKMGTGSDPVVPNLVYVVPPTHLQQADLAIDFAEQKKGLTAYLKETGQGRRIRYISAKDVVNHAIGCYAKGYAHDIIVREGKVLTFRDLTAHDEPLRKIIDKGTITPLTLAEYENGNEDRLNHLRDLINSTLRQDFAQHEIEWIADEKRYRFKMGKTLNARKVPYKTASGRGVVFDVLSKDTQKNIKDEFGRPRNVKHPKHIVCFRHLAFSLSIHLFDDVWYASIKPDWSFTSAMDGKRRSRYSEYYMTGIKRLEWNDSVADQFEFLCDYLVGASKGSMLYPGFKIQIAPLTDTYTVPVVIPDKVWSQSEPKSKDTREQLKLFGQ
jgi:hypothetical protein